METKKLVKLTLIMLLLATIGILFILLLIPDSPVNGVVISFMEWIKNIPKFWGSILLTIIYAISLVFCFPGTPINFAAGYIFGPWLGSVATVLGCDLGAILAFFIGRNLTKEWTESRMQSHPKYGQINSAVSKNGLLIIFLLRLSPIIPFGLCNYLFSATDIPFTKYWISTTLGLLPFTILYTYLGSLMKELTDIFAGASTDELSSKESSSQVAYVTFGIIFSLLVFVAVTVITKRTLNKAMEEQSHAEKLDLEKGLELPLINSGDINIIISSGDHLCDSNGITIKDNGNGNKKEKNREKAMFKRSPTDVDLSIDNIDDDEERSNNNNGKDIILTINNDVEFQNDYDDDYFDNDKSFLIKSNTYNNKINNSNNNNNHNNHNNNSSSTNSILSTSS